MSTEQSQLQDYMRLPAEVLYREELEALRREDTGRIPAGWQMSPRSVLTFIAGGKAGKTVITPKYIGNTRLIEMAVATLVTDRALLLIGEPGTAKSWLSENLAAAIYGNSGLVVQGLPEPVRSMYVIPGTMPCSWRTGQRRRRWSRVRSCGQWRMAA